MTFRQYAPPAPLDFFVQGITFYEGLRTDVQTERFLPNGGIELIIDCTPIPKHTWDPSGSRILQTCKRAWVSGMRTGFITISAGDHSSMMLVFFHPWAARTIFGCEMDTLSDTVVDADQVLGNGVNLLREQILNTTGADAKINVVRSWLDGLMREPSRDVCLSAFSATQLIRRPCNQAIDQVAQDAGVSHKHLTAVFRRTVGVTPKQFQRILRFQKVLASLEQGRGVDWVGVALDCGFYDQAHFVREFKHFSGFTPTEYLARRGALADYVAIS